MVSQHPEDDALEGELRRRAGTDPAREAFRSRLREDFASGGLGSGSGGGERSGTSWKPRVLTAAALVAAAAAVLLLLDPDLSLTDRDVTQPPRWRALVAAGEAPVAGRGGGAPSRSGPDELLAAFESGEQIALQGDDGFELQLGDHLRVRVAPRTRFRASAVGNGPDGAVRFEITEGELFVLAHSERLAGPLYFTTPDALVEVVGTGLSVMADERGTCVCVAHGEARVAPAAEHPEERPANGTTCFVLRDASAAPRLTAFPERPEEHPKLAKHLEPLVAFVDEGFPAASAPR
jgi:hypothetical protein